MKNNCIIQMAAATLLLAVMPAFSQSPPQPTGEPSDSPSAVRRTFIPSDSRREGEVRHQQIGETDQLEIYLYTRSAGRAFREMLKDEGDRCPADHPDHDVSLQFLDALNVFRDHLRELQAQAGDEARPSRVDAAITILNGPDRHTVSFFRARFSDTPDTRDLLEKELLGQIQLPAGYLKEMIDFMDQKYFP